MAERIAKFRLKEYKINKAEISFDVSVDYSGNTAMDIEIERKGAICQENNLYKLELGVKATTHGEDAIKVYANVIGFFEFDSDITDEVKRIFFDVNAPAILFPYVRAYISTLTSLSGIPPIILPTINLMNLD